MALRSTSAPVSAFWPKFGSVRENRVYPSSRTNRSTTSCSHLNLDGSTNTSTSYCIDPANLHRMLWWSSEHWELRKKDDSGRVHETLGISHACPGQSVNLMA